METQPYSLQSPEQIAKDYGGNKQKIAQAMQMGIVDPTAGTLAGMFIDRMRQAQMQEQAPQQTVAQQVMGGLPPQAPQQVPPPPQGGLGATPQAGPQGGPPMAPQPPQGAPQEMIDVPMPSDEAMPTMAAGGMVPPYASGGGLSDVPIPDGMFDEPSNGGFNDGYAGGGIVAFAQGDSVTAPSGFGDYIEQMVRRLDPNIQIAGRARTPARNAQVGGVANSYHLIDAARDISVPPGMSKEAFISQLKGVFGADYDVLPSKGNSVHVEPGPKLGEKVRAGAQPSGIPSILPERDTRTAEGRAMSVEDAMAMGNRLVGNFPREEIERAKKYALEQLDPETQAKEAKMDMWEGLAAMGFRMAASSAPNVLQAIGEAATATLPELKLSKKERKEAKENAIRTLMAAEDVDRKTAIAGAEFGMDVFKAGLSTEQAERALAFQEKELLSRETQAKLDRDLQRDVLEARKLDKTQFEQQVAAYRAVNPGLNDVQIYKLMKDDGLLGSSQGNPIYPGAEGGAGGNTSGMSIVGSRPVK